jgi:tetratricopeptide (TPR) repeat protein
MSSVEPSKGGADSDAVMPRGETSALAQLLADLTGRAEDQIGEADESKTSDGMSEQDKHLLSLVHTYEHSRSDPSAYTPACSDLVDALWVRWEQQPNELTLAACIEMATELVDLCPEDHPYRLSCCSNLAMLLGLRFRQTGESAALEGAVRFLREVLSLSPVGHPDRVECCMNLGVLLQAQYNQTETLALIDEAIKLHREGLSLRPADDPRRAVACANLADTLGARYQQTKESALLDEGIRLSREALALPSSDHRGQAACCTSLAVMLAFRFQQTGDSALLDEALNLNRKALDLRPIGDPDRFIACTKLAIELQRGFVRTGDVAMLHEAIKLHREALALQSDHAPSRATSLQTLATSLNSLFRETGDRALLKEAVQYCREAVDLQPDGHPEHRRASIQLAYALHQLFHQGGGDKEVHDEATALLHWILVALCPPGHRDRLICLSLLGMIGIGDDEHGTTVDILLECLTASAHDILLLQHAAGILRLLNQRCMRASQKQALLSWCSSASDLLLTSTELAADYSAQLQNALRGSGLGTDAYMLASRINSFPMGLQLLEHTRGVIWSQALHLRNPQLDGLPDELAEQLRVVVQGLSATTIKTLDNTRVDGPGSQFFPSRDMLYEQRSRLLEVLQGIRSGPGLHDFMRGLPWQKLLSAAARHPVVVLIADEREAHALIIDSPEHMLAMAFPGFNSNVLQTFTLSASMPSNRGAPMQGANTERIGIGISRRASPSVTILGKLWRSIVKPILNYLRIKASHS